MLEIKNISKSYGKKKVLDDVSFNIDGGRICGLLGLNGAGKSTLLKIICSLVFADAGEVFVLGRKLDNDDKANAPSIGFMIENPAFYSSLTARQNLNALSKLYPDIKKERIEHVLRLTGIFNQADVQVKKFSLGMKQRLYFAYALLNMPKLLILDEPFNGIDPVSIKLFKDIIRALAEAGCTVVISGHVISELQSICDSAVIIDNGKILCTIDDISGISLEEKFLSLVSGSGDTQ